MNRVTGHRPARGATRANWNAQHEAFLAEHGRRQRVFCASLSDWADNEVPIAWLDDLLELVRTTPNLDWLMLTKRIGNVIKRIKAAADCEGKAHAISDRKGALLTDWPETLRFREFPR